MPRPLAPGIIRRNSLGGSSSSGSQDKPSRGVTFAADMSRIVSGRKPNKSDHFLNPFKTKSSK